MSKSYALSETRIRVGGVFRCCHASVAHEYEAINGLLTVVEIGAKSKCQHCDTTFTLVAGETNPVWTPDWQLEQLEV